MDDNRDPSPTAKDTIGPDPEAGENSTGSIDAVTSPSVNILRLRGNRHDGQNDGEKQDTSGAFENSCVVIPRPENEIEAQRISNNYLFGLKKWKSHITSRPLSTRSEIVQNLYADINELQPSKVSTVRPTNVIYVVLIGWWLSLIYVIMAGLLFATYIGRKYGMFCWKMAGYFVWPFGKFIHQVHPVSITEVAEQSSSGSYQYSKENGLVHENSSLLHPLANSAKKTTFRDLLKKPETYIWLVLGVPVLGIIHFVVTFITWLFVITIPIAKLNFKCLTIMFLPPDQIEVGDSFITTDSWKHSEILLFTHQSVNVYYYKYTVDGVNVILANLLVFVVLALLLGYTDPGNVHFNGVSKCILGVLAIIPLTYYIGMAIASISAQSSFAIGAILNATFGSMVEIILFIIVLKKGLDTGKMCYQELVKSSLAGAILASILFIPAASMIVGGLKYRTQNFNPRSAGVSSSLLFVSIAGVFAPSLFSKIYGETQCHNCVQIIDETPVANASTPSNFTGNSTGFQCSDCTTSIFGLNGDHTLYDKHILPLVYACALVLPLAYIIGLLFTLKTHSSHIYEAFEQQLMEDRANTESNSHGAPQWSRLKSTIILLFCAVFIALCADLITDNIQPLLEVSGISEYFIGVTMLAVIPELPEVVNGIQFALQNNVNLGIEIGSSTAIQVCLVQVPLLVLINLIYPMNFIVIFNDVHLWSVIFSVIVINYIFQDGKSDYFQGFIMLLIYIVLMSMYFFTLTPPEAKC